jgi:homoserine dehydrogenase
MQKLNIGLFGFGCVGQGLYEVLKGSLGINAEILKIGVKNADKKRPLPPDMFTYEKGDLLGNSEINLIVELIDDANAAFDIVKQALESGKNVVTANKKMVAENLQELIALQQKNGTSLLYEASSCGSIPIIRTLEEYYGNEHLKSVSGIFNGSSNFILTQISQKNLSYEDALKLAQEMGFAETDPSLDVGGFDPKYKLIILIAHAFGKIIPPSRILNIGIETLSTYDLKFAREKGWKLKLTPKVYMTDENSITAYVLPSFISKENYLYNVEFEYNAVTVQASFSQKQLFYGKGAGGHPTGSAVLSDISANAFNYKYEYKKLSRPVDNFKDNAEIKVYLRVSNASLIKDFRFNNIEETFSSEKFCYVIGTIRLDEIQLNRDRILNTGSFIATLPE